MLEYDNREVEFPTRFKLMPVNGTTDVFDLVPVPGEITKEGRALNKEFFDSIKGDIQSITVDKYYKPTYEALYDEVLKTYDWSYIPLMSSTSQNGFNITTSGSIGNPTYMFNTTSNYTTIGKNAIFKIELDTAIVPKELKLQSSSSSSQCSIFASIDGLNYDVLVENQSMSSGSDTIVDLSQCTSYYKYIMIDNTDKAQTYIRYFKITKAVIKEYTENKLVFDFPFNKKQNQRMLLQTPAELKNSLPTQIEFTNGTVDVNGIFLKENKLHELIYNNLKFDVLSTSVRVTHDFGNSYTGTVTYDLEINMKNILFICISWSSDNINYIDKVSYIMDSDMNIYVTAPTDISNPYSKAESDSSPDWSFKITLTKGHLNIENYTKTSSNTDRSHRYCKIEYVSL